MTQFGFRQGRGTSDAIFMVRRHIALAPAQRGGQTAFVALDCKKCFDSINVDVMIGALRRFGLPDKMLRMIHSSYLRVPSVRRTGCWAVREEKAKIRDSTGMSLVTFSVCHAHDSGGPRRSTTFVAQLRATFQDRGSRSRALRRRHADHWRQQGQLQEFVKAVASVGAKFNMGEFFSMYSKCF